MNEAPGSRGELRIAWPAAHAGRLCLLRREAPSPAQLPARVET